MQTIIRYLLYALVFIIGYVSINSIVSSFDPLSTFADYINLRLLYIVFGIVCSIPNFLEEWKKNGIWRCHYMKLLFIGLPSFYFSFNWVIYFYLPDFLRNPSFTNNNYEVASFILGYILVSSFYKESKL